MAKRPSVQEILAAARAGGSVKPSGSPISQSEREAGPPEQPAAELADLSSAPLPTPAAPAPSAAALGRPLTLKEKLAAARAGAVPAQPAAPATPAAPIADVAVPAARVVPPPATPTGRPLTMQEKLAAARAGGATPAAGAAKPAAGVAKPAATTKAVPAARALPPLSEIADPLDMAEALRRAGTEHEQAAKAAAATAAAEKAGATPARAAAAGKAVAAKAPATPKVVPPRPERAGTLPAATAAAPAPSRRRFFPVSISWIAAGWATFAAGTAAFSWMCLRFMFPNVLAEPPSTIKVGAPANFEKGEVNERWKAEWGFWIVRAVVDGQDELYALQSICTHLGCPPNWLAGEQKFKCPCHGSGFYITGVNFEGPAPRPLERFKISLADDGQVLIDKSQKFQFELGQWSDPDSFIPV